MNRIVSSCSVQQSHHSHHWSGRLCTMKNDHIKLFTCCFSHRNSLKRDSYPNYPHAHYSCNTFHPLHFAARTGIGIPSGGRGSLPRPRSQFSALSPSTIRPPNEKSKRLVTLFSWLSTDLSKRYWIQHTLVQ